MKTVAYSAEVYSSKAEESARVSYSNGTFDEWEVSEFFRMSELFKGVWRNNVRMIYGGPKSQDSF